MFFCSWYFQGDGSSDEEDVVLDDVPDDDEYDTEDSFIDDTELVGNLIRQLYSTILFILFKLLVLVNLFVL